MTEGRCVGGSCLRCGHWQVDGRDAMVQGQDADVLCGCWSGWMERRCAVNHMSFQTRGCQTWVPTLFTPTLLAMLGRGAPAFLPLAAPGAFALRALLPSISCANASALRLLRSCECQIKS